MLRVKRKLAVCSLASGSKGNAYWLEAGNTSVLIDAGISHRQLMLRLKEKDRDLEQLDHVFISHEHGDHVKGLELILKKYSPVLWASRGTLQSLRKYIPHAAKVRMLGPNPEEAGAFTVKSIPISHDSRQPCGFRFTCDQGTVAILTDLGKWDAITREAVRGVDILVCEANHDPQMLRNGPYPFQLKQRILSLAGHLSNEEGALLALEAAKEGTREFILGHLSETNNTPAKALSTFSSVLSSFNGEINLNVAAQNSPGPWIKANGNNGKIIKDTGV